MGCVFSHHKLFYYLEFDSATQRNIERNIRKINGKRKDDNDDNNKPKKSKQSTPGTKLPKLEVVDISKENPEWLSDGFPKGEKMHINMNDFSTYLPSAGLKGLKYVQSLGHGNYGYVFQVCDEHGNCDRALKIVPFNKTDEGKFKYEAEVSYVMGEHGIGPKVFDYWICPVMLVNDNGKLCPAGMILMQKKDTTLAEFITENMIRLRMNNFDKGEVKFYMEQIELAKNMLLEKAYKMAQVKYNGKKGYLHGDIGSENVVVTLKNGRIEDIYFIDFAIVGRPKKLRKNLDDVKYQIEDMFDLLSDLSEESSSSSDSE
jgi:hypothetical protein